jgi:hypothetical protein
MTTLGMTLADTLSPVTKVNFKKWHNEGSLALLDAGNGQLDITLSRLNDMSIDWRSLGKQVTRHDTNKHEKMYMFSNGCDEFILVIDDGQYSEYSKEYRNRTNKQHMTIYIVND